jgi:hypothetical protein
MELEPRTLRRHAIPLCAAITLFACGDATPPAEAPVQGATQAPDVITIQPPARSAAPVAATAGALKTAAAPSSSPSAVAALPGSASSQPATGGTVPNAGAVVGSLAPDFRNCYNAALQKDANARGNVRITAKVGADGRVVQSSATVRGGLEQEVGDCCALAVDRAQFAPPEGAGATLVIPITFTTPP